MTCLVGTSLSMSDTWRPPTIKFGKKLVQVQLSHFPSAWSVPGCSLHCEHFAKKTTTLNRIFWIFDMLLMNVLSTTGFYTLFQNFDYFQSKNINLVTHNFLCGYEHCAPHFWDDIPRYDFQIVWNSSKFLSTTFHRYIYGISKWSEIPFKFLCTGILLLGGATQLV